MADIDKEFIEFKKKAELKRLYNKKYYLKKKENKVKKPKYELTLDEFKQLKERELLKNKTTIKTSSKQELKNKILELEKIILELNKINKINDNKTI